MKNKFQYIRSSITRKGSAHHRMSLIINLKWLGLAIIFLGTTNATFINTAPSPKNINATNPLDKSPVSSGMLVSEMTWVFLGEGSNGPCMSNTDCCANTFCYGLQYTPANSGTLTSYTTGFFVDCVMNGSPVLSNSSCIMDDNSSELNGCVDYDLILMNCSGNEGTLIINAGVPIIIHQVCFSLPPGETINVAEDEVTDLTVSINLSGGGFTTELPTYATQAISHSNIVTNPSNTGIGSLRHVANCAPAGSTIVFAPSLMNQTINLTTGMITINKNLKVEGPGVNALTVSGNNSSVIFHVLPGYGFTVKNMSLKNGSAPVNGGAIFGEGNLTLQNVLLQNNFENGIPKALTITNSSFVEILGNVNFKP